MNVNNIDEKKEKRKAYMREYMRKRNIKLRGEPRRKLTTIEKKEKQRVINKKKYLRNREKLLEYARKKREKKTGITRLDRIKILINTLTLSEKSNIINTLTCNN